MIKLPAALMANDQTPRNINVKTRHNIDITMKLADPETVKTICLR